MHIKTKTTVPEAEILPRPTDVGALGNRINFNTRTEHNAIDRTITFKFAIALRDARIYRQGIQGFYHMFKAVEVCLYKELAKEPKTKTGEILSKFWKDEIARTEPLERDLSFFYHNDRSKFENPIREGQIEVVKHIYEAYEKNPHILLAYCHVLYLALFAGGRLMFSSLTKASGIFPQLDGKTTAEVSKFGTNFFKFEVSNDEMLRIQYKRDYELATRNALTEQEKTDIIEEAKFCFQSCVNIVKEIEAHNRAKITGKLSYKLLHYGYYVMLVLVPLILLVLGHRVLSHFF